MHNLIMFFEQIEAVAQLLSETRRQPVSFACEYNLFLRAYRDS